MEPQYNALNNQPCFPCIPARYPGLPILTHLFFCIPLVYLFLIYAIAARKELPFILSTYTAFRSREWEATTVLQGKVTPCTCIRICVCKCIYTLAALAAKASFLLTFASLLGLIRSSVLGKYWWLLNLFQGLNVDLIKVHCICVLSFLHEIWSCQGTNKLFMTYACTVTKNGLMGARTTLKVLQSGVPWTGDSLKEV